MLFATFITIAIPLGLTYLFRMWATYLSSREEKYYSREVDGSCNCWECNRFREEKEHYWATQLNRTPITALSILEAISIILSPHRLGLRADDEYISGEYSEEEE